MQYRALTVTLTVLVAACGASEHRAGLDLAVDAGADVAEQTGAVGPNGELAGWSAGSGAHGGSAGKAATSETVKVTATPIEVDAGSTTGLAGNGGMGGVGGSEPSSAGTGGSAGSADEAGSGAAGEVVTAGAGGVGGETAGTGGAGGAPGEPACPLGTVDDDGNGYADACEQRLWSHYFSRQNVFEPGADYSATSPGFLVMTRGSGCNLGTDLAHEFYVMPYATDTTVIDARTNDAAALFAECLASIDNTQVAVAGVMAAPGTTDYEGSSYNAAGFDLGLQPHLGGKHIVYFRWAITAYKAKFYNPGTGTGPGTLFMAFAGSIGAYGY